MRLIKTLALPAMILAGLTLTLLMPANARPAANGQAPELSQRPLILLPAAHPQIRVPLIPDLISQGQPQLGVQDKYVSIFGQKIHYLEAGSGPTVILLHGLGGDTSHWALTIPALAGKYHVLVPDQIGFGRSDKPLINYRVGTYLDFLDKFCAELNLRSATVVGNSLGGWIAAGFALKYPDRVDKLVLVDAAGFAAPKNVDAAALAPLNPVTRDQIRQIISMVVYNKSLFLTDTAVDLGLTGRLSAGDGYTIERLTESILRREDVLDDRLGEIKAPTLILWGREDGLLTLAQDGERFHRELPRAQMIIFEKCGHAPMLEQPAQFNEALLNFLAS